VTRKEQTQAAEFYKDTLATVLDNSTVINKLIKASYDNFYFSTHYYSKLIQDKTSAEVNERLVHLMFNWLLVIILCDNQPCQSALRTYNTIVIKFLRLHELKELAALIMLDFENLGSVTAVRELLRYRAQYLRNETQVAPVFSYSMPDVYFFNHPYFEDFMKSDLPYFEYMGPSRGGFASRKEADEFVERYGGDRDKYSTSMNAWGRNNKIKVKITKTNEYHKRNLIVYHQFCEELKRIEILLDE
jgi:hypothetical protein